MKNWLTIPQQLCPKCNGDGHLLRYNSPPMLGTTNQAICDVCKGKKVIPFKIIKSYIQEQYDKFLSELPEQHGIPEAFEFKEWLLKN